MFQEACICRTHRCPPITQAPSIDPVSKAKVQMRLDHEQHATSSSQPTASKAPATAKYLSSTASKSPSNPAATPPIAPYSPAPPSKPTSHHLPLSYQHHHPLDLSRHEHDGASIKNNTVYTPAFINTYFPNREAQSSFKRRAPKKTSQKYTRITPPCPNTPLPRAPSSRHGVCTKHPPPPT